MYTLSTSSTITVALDAAYTTTAPVATVTYSDVQLSDGVVTARAPVATGKITVGAVAAVTIVGSPASGYAREVENIAIINHDTVSHIVTLGGAIDLSFTVPAGQILLFDGRAWQLGATNVIALAGDVTGTSNAAMLAASGVTAGTYRSLTVDAKGRATGGTNPTTLSGYGIMDAVSSALAAGWLFVGNSSGVATAVAMSGDVTITSTGAATVGSIGGHAVSLAGALTQTGPYAWGVTIPGAYTYTYPAATGALASLAAIPQTFAGCPTFSNSTYSALFTGGSVGVGTTSPRALVEASAYSSSGTVWNLCAANRNNTADTGYGVGLKLALSDPAENATKWGGISAVAERIYGSLISLNFWTQGDLNDISSPTVKWVMGYDGTLYPATDNEYSVGTASNRASVIYAGTGTINTSDSSQKTNVRKLTNAELACFLEIAGNACVYQWTDSVSSKGADVARLHVGYIADDAVAFDAVSSVKAICEKHGIDPNRWGFFCRDVNKISVTKTRTVQKQKTESKTRTVEAITVTDGVAVLATSTESYDSPVFEMLTVKDSSGNVILNSDGSARTYQNPVMEEVTETYTEQEDEIDASGNAVYRYGLRYTELREAIAAAEHAALVALTVRVAAL